MYRNHDARHQTLQAHACGGIAQAINAAQQIAPGKLVEVEMESLEELRQALEAGADIATLNER